MDFAHLLTRAATFGSSTLTVRSGSSATSKSFPEFVADVRALQHSLLELGVLPGHLVGVQAAGSYDFLVWDVALTDMRAIPQIFPEEWSVDEMQEAAAASHLAFFVSEQIGTLVRPMPDDGRLSDYVSVLMAAVPSEDDDLLTHVYSSGTSGTLKGLRISRRGAETLAGEYIETFAITRDDRFLVFLPLSHFQQRLAVYMCLFSGVSFMYTPPTHVFHDIPRFQPTFLIGPPIFYETALATLLPRAVGREALASGFGGKVRFMITGMAPIRQAVLESYQRHDVPLIEAYGITEVGVVAWNTPADNRIGTVGRPLKSHEVRLSTDSEILVKARHPLTKGYFRADDGDSERTFLDSGYVATGDIGDFDEGRLVLKGRKKDIIVTSAGAKFHPLELERRILACHAIKQAVVMSDSYRGDVVAVVCVENPHDAETLALVDRVVQSINESVPSYNRIGRTILTGARFSEDNGMLTRNLKPNRAVIAGHFSTPEAYPMAAGV